MYDKLITGGHLLTMQGDGVGFIEGGAVATDGRRIVAVGPRSEVEGNDRAREVIDATGQLVMPGLVDAHTHSSAVLGRGWAQEVTPWMASAYGPMMRHADKANAPLGTMVALMEGVANGTTTFGDYVNPMNELARSHATMGNRAVVCESVTELNWSNREEWLKQGWKPGDPTPLDPATGERTLASSLGVFDNWDGYDAGRIRVILGPHAADFLSKEMLLRVQQEARKRNTLMHLHVAQDPRENLATEQRYGLRAIPFLDSIGLLGPDLIAVHLCFAEPDEVKLVAERGARMICCSNSIGIIDGVVPPAWLMTQLGGLVALGSDQAPGNNSHNVFSEMRATAMFAKIKEQSPLPMPAWQVLRMATINGAKVLGIGDIVGSLEAGKEADIIMLDLTRPPLAPVLLRPARNIVPNLVYAETGSNVVMTMVAGSVIYQNGEYTNIDRHEVMRELAAVSEQLQEATAADPLVNDLAIVRMTRDGKI
ncbi:MAG TPA: amidohydrolase family protein [Thermomicrobiales bacterium]|nr:amidohydrolase family protein [Thermomicrobiales bacterium]